jgi:gliding motility-associated-like protein
MHGEAQAPSFTWVRSAGAGSEQEGYAVAADLSGNTYVTGYMKGSSVNFSSVLVSSAGGKDIFLAKYDQNGNILWVTTAGGSGDDVGTSVAVDNAGNVYICGNIDGTATFLGAPNITLSGPGNFDVFVAKYNSSGSVLWAKRAGSSNGGANGVCTNGTDVFITGEFSGSIQFGSLPVMNSVGGDDIFIASYNATTGTENWALRGGSSSNDLGDAIAVDASGVYVSGSYRGTCTFQNMAGSLANNGVNDVCLVKYNLSGTGQWMRRAGGTGDDHETSVCVGGSFVYVAGHFAGTMNLYNTGPSVATITSAGGDDAFVIQYNTTTGNYSWVRSENGTGNDKAKAIAVNPAGDVFLTGNFDGTLPFGSGPSVTAQAQDIFVTSYNSSGTFQWGKKVAGAQDDFGYGIAAPDNTSVYVGGSYKSSPATFDAQTISTSSNFDIFIAKLGCTCTVSNAGADQAVCISSAAATLTGITPITGTGAWTLISGTGTIASPASPSSSVSGLSLGSNVFQWTITNSVCPASTFDQVTITVNDLPTTANAGPDQTFCSSSGTLAGNAPTIGTGVWTRISGSGTASIPSSPTSGVTGLAVGSSVYQWTITNGVCPSSTDQVTLTVDANPTTANAGPDQTLCSATAAFAGNNPAIGTGAWSLVSGTGVINSPASNTSAVNGLSVGANTFRWTTSNGTCPSSSDLVIINVDPFPTVSNAGPDQSVCSGSASLAGNTPTTGSGSWSLVSGTGSITNATSPTSAVTGLSVGANVFKWTISSGTCPSSFDNITITRDANPTTANAGPDQTLCTPSATLAGNVPSIGTGAWSLVSGTGSITTPAANNSGVTGLVTGPAVFQWTISNGTCPSSTDQVTINHDANPTVANAGPDQTICSSSATFAGNVPSTGSGFWTLISGTGIITTPSSASSTVTGLSVGNNVFQWTISNGTCPSTSDQVIITRDPVPTTANAGPDQTICAASTSLAGNNPATGTGVWTLISGTGTIVTPGSPTSTVNGLSVGANTFRWTISNGTCAASFDQVTINVDANPTIANAGPDQTICSGNSLFAGNNPVNGTGSWALVSGTGTITTPSSPTSAVTGLSVGANVFRWTISNGTCPSSSDLIIITRDANPTTANAGVDQTICSAASSFTGNAPATGTGTWTLISGTGTIVSPSSAGSAVNGLSTGANVFQWTISNGTCPSSSDQVTITRDPNPSVANAGPDQTICSSSATFVGSLPSVGNGTWTLISGTGIITTPGSNTSAVTGLSIGANVFQWTITNGTCPASSDQVIITRDANPSTANAGVDQTICSAASSFTGNTPVTGTGTWTLISGTGTIVSPSSPTSAVNGLSIGANVFQWTISNGTCASSSDQVTINRDTTPSIANAGPDQTLCTSSTSLAGNSPAIGTGTWTLVSGTGAITTPSSNTSAVTGLITGTAVFQWTITNGTCPASTDQVTINHDANPTIANAGVDQTICSAASSFTGNTPVTGTGTWTLISGTGTIVSPTSSTSAINGLSIGANVFQWTISNGTCPSSSDQVTINRDANPTVASAGTDQTVCSSSGTFAGNLPSIGNGTWTLISGTGVIATPSSNVSNVTGLSVGANVFQWTISNGTCPSSSDQVVINRDANPTAANAGIDQTICSSSSSFNGNNPVTGNGIWTLISGTGTIVSPSSPTSAVNGLSIGANVFQWTISNGTCTSVSDQVTINVDENPTVADAGTDQTLCGSSSSFAGNVPTVGTGVWTLISGAGTITTASSPASSVTALNAGTNIFQWTISNGTCPASIDQVVITRDADPTTANAGADQTICSSSTSLAGNAPVVGTGTWTRISGTSTITAPTSNTSSVTGLTVGTNIFQWTISNGVCPSSSDQVTITVDPNPTLANAGPDDVICSSASSFNANIPSTGNGAWTLISGTGTIATPSSPTSAVTGLSVGANVFQWTISNGTCPPSGDQVTITVDANPTTANAGADQTVCSGSTTLSGNTPAIGSGMWTLVSGTGTIVTPASANSVVNGLSIGANVFQWTISNGTCPSSIDLVTIYRDPPPTAANAGTDQTICNSSATLSGNTPATGTGNWSLISGTGIITAPSSSTSVITGLSVGANVFQWTISNGACAASSDQVTINVDADPTIANAGPDQTICSSSSAFTGNIPLTGTGTWNVVSGPGIISNPAQASSAVTNLVTGNNLFEWVISNGVCPSSHDTVSVFIDQYPTTANAGNDQQVCSSAALMNGNTPATGVGTWLIVNSTGNFTGASLPNTSVTNMAEGNNTFEWVIANGTCPASRDTVVIRVDNIPSTANAGPDQTICSATSALQGTQPSVGSGTWYVLNGSASLANPLSETSSVTNLSEGQNKFQWIVTNGVCPVSIDTVQIYVDSMPTAANAGPPQNICSSLASLNGNIPLTGNGQWLTISSTGIISNPSQPSTNVNGLGIGQNIFQWVISNGTCDASRDTIIITVDENPSISFAGVDALICDPLDTLHANIPLVGNGTWYSISSPPLIGNPFSATTEVSSLVPGWNSFEWVVSNGVCPATRDTVSVFYTERPSAPDAGADIYECAHDVVMHADVPSIGTGYWFNLSNTGSFSDATDPSSALNNLPDGSYLYTWTTSNSYCVSRPDTIVVNIYSPPTLADAGPDQLVHTTFATLHATPCDTGTGTWTFISGAGQIEDPNNPASRVTDLANGINILRWTTSNGVCIETTDEMQIESKTLIIPTGYSPNADGTNDNFEIDGLLEYSNVSLEIFNRWGNQVYITADYKNDWNGTGSNGEILPDDIYYFILKLEDGTAFTGYVSLKRRTL